MPEISRFRLMFDNISQKVAITFADDSTLYSSLSFNVIISLTELIFNKHDVASAVIRNLDVITD